MVREPDVLLTDNDISGYWKIIARPLDAEPVDITFVRGAPTTVETLTFLDPFGPAEATLTFPSITMVDTYGPGSGDLYWLRPEVDVDIVWTPTGAVPDTSERWNLDAMRWEGYVINFGWSFTDAGGSLQLQLRGALFQLDNYLAMQEYLLRPIPFEFGIARQFRNKPGLRVGFPTIVWPSWWDRTYELEEYEDKPRYMRPRGVAPGEKWTGMLTRETGQRDQVLSSYIQGLLSAMYTDQGQWTLLLNAGRTPVIRHRDMILEQNKADLYVDLVQPGLAIDLDQDWTQRANVAFGRGRSLSGVTYSGMQVTPSGSMTWYKPFAHMPVAHPEGDDNPNYAPEVMRKEINLDFYEGMSPSEAMGVARDHLRRFSDPGITGTLTFTASDPRSVKTGQVFPRQLVQAGMSIRVDGLFGARPGQVFHVAESVTNPNQNTTTLTVDSRFRDWVTVQEVQQRGRDSLQVARMLTVGNYQPNIPDQLLPWNYNKGSGAIPLGSKDYFEGAPETLQFPWEDWVKEHPPKDNKQAFIKVRPVNKRNADKNWNRWGGSKKRKGKITPVLFSVQGDVKLLQIAAFWGNGERAKVAFHIGIYEDYGATAQDMPYLPENIRLPGNRRYKDGQHYPFYQDAFETINEGGETLGDNYQGQVTAEGLGMVVAYGNYYAKAGYWPNSYSEDVEPTGLLVDETGFPYDHTSSPEYKPEGDNPQNFKELGRFGVLVYCDDQGERPVYFLGRAWRREYGTS